MDDQDNHRRELDPLLLQIHDDLQNIKALQESQKLTLDEMKEILTVWNNTKGFIKTIALIGEVMKWSVAVGAAVAAVWWWWTGVRK